MDSILKIPPVQEELFEQGGGGILEDPGDYFSFLMQKRFIVTGESFPGIRCTINNSIHLGPVQCCSTHHTGLQRDI